MKFFRAGRAAATLAAFGILAFATPAQAESVQELLGMTTSDVYVTGGPLHIDSKGILKAINSSSTPATSIQPVAPPEILGAEISALNRNFVWCVANSASCSVSDRLQIVAAESNAVHEAALRMNSVCSVLGYDNCLYPQSRELEQWSEINDQMRVILSSMQTISRNPQEYGMLLSDRSSTVTADQLNNLAPAAGDNTAK
jgi:hypothetical protein